MSAFARVVPPVAAGGELDLKIGEWTTILIVEDDARVRAMSRRVLAGQAYRVIEAVNGADALRVATMQDGRIDLILTDVGMPSIGVRAMLSRLQQTNPESVVLIMSGHSDAELLTRGFDKGDDPFLAKPFSGWELVAAVKEALATRGGPRL